MSKFSRSLIFIYALIIYGFAFNLGNILPTNVSWLDSVVYDDRWVHYFGWAFYRQAPWAWPITKFNNYMYPVGDLISNVDCIPWVAVFFKLLSPILPKTFQYFGLWHFFSFVLLGIFSRRIFLQLKLNPLQALLGSFLLMTSGSLLERHHHITLTAHWLILASLSLVISFYVDRNYKKYLLLSIAMVVFILGIHPYLWMFSLLIFGLSMMFESQIHKRWFYIGSLLGPSMITMWFLGLSGSGSPAAGFEYYSADLLTFFDPIDTSKILPRLTQLEGTKEGFAYLGLANIVLLILTIVLIFKKGISSIQFTPLLKYSVILFSLSYFLSLSSSIRVGDTLILSLRFYDYLEPYPSTFRAPGRLIWIAQYILMIAIWIYYCSNAVIKNRPVAIFLKAFIILFPWIESRRLIFPEHPPQVKNSQLKLSPQNKKIFTQWNQEFDSIRVFPLSQFEMKLRPQWMNSALENNKSIEMGRSARQNNEIVQKIKEAVYEKIITGNLDKKSIYLIPIRVAENLYKDNSSIACLKESYYSICRSRVARMNATSVDIKN